MDRAVQESAEQRANPDPLSDPANRAWFLSTAAVTWEHMAASFAS
jgi:hypothetical protein